MNLLRSLSLAIAGLAITMAAWAEQDTSSALVQLNGDPLATFIKTKPEQGKKINFDAAKVKAYRATAFRRSATTTSSGCTPTCRRRRSLATSTFR
jgi:hypothetical protein